MEGMEEVSLPPSQSNRLNPGGSGGGDGDGKEGKGCLAGPSILHPPSPSFLPTASIFSPVISRDWLLGSFVVVMIRMHMCVSMKLISFPFLTFSGNGNGHLFLSDVMNVQYGAVASWLADIPLLFCENSAESKTFCHRVSPSPFYDS